MDFAETAVAENTNDVVGLSFFGDVIDDGVKLGAIGERVFDALGHHEIVHAGGHVGKQGLTQHAFGLTLDVADP